MATWLKARNASDAQVSNGNGAALDIEKAFAAEVVQFPNSSDWGIKFWFGANHYRLLNTSYSDAATASEGLAKLVRILGWSN